MRYDGRSSPARSGTAGSAVYDAALRNTRSYVLVAGEGDIGAELCASQLARRNAAARYRLMLRMMEETISSPMTTRRARGESRELR